MAVEIERKFLVDTNKWTPDENGIMLKQAYLGIAPYPTIRVRISDEKAFLTIKGRSESISRPEFEYEIPLADAEEMMKLAITDVVAKTRYKKIDEGFLWEIDVFSGKNTGLVLAEIELESEDQKFPLPDWLLEEVSGDARYYNSSLSGFPFTEW